MALGFTVLGFHIYLKVWFEKETVKLTLDAFAIAVIKVSKTSLTPAIAAAQSYGENGVNFTEYVSFPNLCGSASTCAVAEASLLGRREAA